MIKGIFIFFSGKYACSNQVDMEMRSDKKSVTRKSHFIIRNCFGEPPQIYQDLDCVIRYEIGPALRFTACVVAEYPLTIKATSLMGEGDANQLLRTIAKLN